MITSNTEKGSATVEVAILLPIYVFCLIALVFLGTYHTMDIRILRAVNSFAQQPGEQTNEDLPEEMTIFATANFPNQAIGPNVVDATEAEIFSPEDILEFINESSYDATGHYEMDGDDVVLITDINTTGLGRIVERYNLFNLTDKIAEEMSRTLERSSTSVEFSLAFPFSTPAQGSSDRVELDFENNDLINLKHEHHHVIRRVGDDNRKVIRKTQHDTQSQAGLPLDPIEEIYGGDRPYVTFSDRWERFREPDRLPEDDEE
jgi:hypothetical protein